VLGVAGEFVGIVLESGGEFGKVHVRAPCSASVRTSNRLTKAIVIHNPAPVNP
jgi:hypothetical protein